MLNHITSPPPPLSLTTPLFKTSPSIMQSYNQRRNNSNGNQRNNNRRNNNNSRGQRQNNTYYQQQPIQQYDPTMDHYRGAYQQFQYMVQPQLNFEYSDYQRFQIFTDVILDKNQKDCVMHQPTCGCYECVVNNRNIYKRIYEDIRMYQMINDLYVNGNTLNINPMAPWNVNKNAQIPDTLFVCDYDINGNIKSSRNVRLTQEQKDCITFGLKTFDEVYESFLTPASREHYRKKKQQIKELTDN